uniref:Uncharacterized protein n=1 Tax=Anguilla anguilla TaxID=7936 RepID=A0A0E9SFX8_ANGAN
MHLSVKSISYSSDNFIQCKSQPFLQRVSCTLGHNRPTL